MPAPTTTTSALSRLRPRPSSSCAAATSGGVALHPPRDRRAVPAGDSPTARAVDVAGGGVTGGLFSPGPIGRRRGASLPPKAKGPTRMSYRDHLPQLDVVGGPRGTDQQGAVEVRRVRRPGRVTGDG